MYILDVHMWLDVLYIYMFAYRHRCVVSCVTRVVTCYNSPGFSSLPPDLQVFWRSLLSILFTLSRGKAFASPKRKWLLLLRGLCGHIALSAYLESLDRIPLAEAVFLGKVHPMAAAILSYIFLGEALSMARAIGICCPFLGWRWSRNLPGPGWSPVTCSAISWPCWQVPYLEQHIAVCAACHATTVRMKCGPYWRFHWFHCPSVPKMLGLGPPNTKQALGHGCWCLDFVLNWARSFWCVALRCCLQPLALKPCTSAHCPVWYWAVPLGKVFQALKPPLVRCWSLHLCNWRSQPSLKDPNAAPTKRRWNDVVYGCVPKDGVLALDQFKRWILGTPKRVPNFWTHPKDLQQLLQKKVRGCSLIFRIRVLESLHKNEYRTDWCPLLCWTNV